VRAVEWLHRRFVHPSRVRILGSIVAELLPAGASVLDVGCGDGRVSRLVCQARADLHLVGIDTLARPDAAIPIQVFDGHRIPYEAGSWDAVMLVDVLHHADDPAQLLREAARVASRAIVVKDHVLQGSFAGPVLRFMDSVGNRRHGVEMPYNYWTRERWLDAFERLGLEIVSWRDRLGLYSPPLSWVFERDLHFVACLDPGSGRSR